MRRMSQGSDAVSESVESRSAAAFAARGSAGGRSSQRPIRTSLFLLALLFLPGMGCAGGGTSGTGISGVARMTGTAYSSAGRPLAGMTITISTPNEERTLVTEEDGSYDTFLEYQSDEEMAFTFASDDHGVSSRWTFDEIPEGTATIVNRWDQDGSQMRPTTTDFLDEDGDPIGLEEEMEQ